VRTFELGRMMDRSGRTRFAAKPAIHAFGHINIELRDDDFASLRVLLNGHRYAVNRAGPITSETTRADFQVDVENPPVPKRQRILYAHWNAIGILNRIGLADHVRGSDRHAI